MSRTSDSSSSGEVEEAMAADDKTAGEPAGKAPVEKAPEVSPWAGDARRTLVAIIATVVAGTIARGLVAVNGVDGSLGARVTMAVAITLITGYAVLLGSYAALTWVVFARMAPAEFARTIVATTPQTEADRRRDRRRGTSSGAWLQLGAGLALAAVVALVLLDELRGNLALLLGSLVLVIMAWLLMMVSGTLMLVREDIGRTGQSPSLDFPGSDPRRWQDYAYLAIQVCTTFSSSDVAVTTTRMRRAVTSLAATAFVFNTVIVALLVSMLLSVG